MGWFLKTIFALFSFLTVYLLLERMELGSGGRIEKNTLTLAKMLKVVKRKKLHSASYNTVSHYDITDGEIHYCI